MRGVSVADVMRDQVVAVRERARFTEIVAVMRRFHISSLPVIDSQDRVIGLIFNDDLLVGGGAHDPGASGVSLLDRLLRRAARPVPDVADKLATELMSSPPTTVTGTTPACEAAREMYRCRIHQLPVVDDTTGRLTGIVTRPDLLAVYERPDDDIRGEILHDIIEHTLGLTPERFDVTAVGGAVTIRGRLEHRSDTLWLADAIAHVGGVIAVVDRLVYEVDDIATKTPRTRL